MDSLFDGLAFAMREATLFAAAGFLLLGASDLLVDWIWIARTLRRRVTIYRRYERACANRLALPGAPGRLAIFVPAWDEAAVIGDMLPGSAENLRSSRLSHLCWLLSKRSRWDRRRSRRERSAHRPGDRPGSGPHYEGRLPQHALGKDDRRRGGRRAPLQGCRAS